MSTRVRGRVWRFGDDVDTDAMAPWNTISLPFEERRRHVLQIRPEFARDVKPGDVIVAGRNWGCGSSREHAPENLKRLGVGGVVAESFGRIYFRNGIAMAFPQLACPGIHAACAEGDDLEFDVRSGRVVNHTRGTELEAPPYTDQMLAILEAGGLLEVLQRRRAAAGATGRA
ncbi:MAG: 3-isopropylmalate dehydratase [Deltaproteobacteria bacterium]|nr:MAG: 3-isopropylmalate dehydratase [Deltaproteobacteria bacterium]